MNAKRLLKLADFLDRMPREKFDFAQIVEQRGLPMRKALQAGKTRCGTVGCAIGWMPAAFPRGLRWAGNSDVFPDVVLRRDESLTDFDAAVEWFGITRAEADVLFVPGAKRWGYSGLRETASAKDVARHIRQWVRAQQKAARSAA
jgi:hypothetical protein